MRAPELDIRVEGAEARLSGTLDFETTPGAHERLARLIATETELTLDLGGIERSNSAGLALLVECVAEAGRHGHRVRFRDVPAGLRQLAEVSEVDHLIDLSRV